MSDPSETFRKLYETVKRLRAPDGCPWDREQTPESLRSCLVEEAYECVDAIDAEDAPHVMEELGDVALLVVMIASIYEERGAFTLSDALVSINDKLVRRHPHVFGDAAADTPDAVIKQWNDIKKSVEGRAPKDSILDEVKRGFPPLERSYKLQRKAAKVGFDWPEVEQVWDKVHEEADEIRAACASGDKSHVEEEMGDLLFSVVNVSRFLDVDPSVALNRANAKFEARFKYVEARMREKGHVMDKPAFAEMDALWNEAKDLNL